MSIYSVYLSALVCALVSGSGTNFERDLAALLDSETPSPEALNTLTKQLARTEEYQAAAKEELSLREPLQNLLIGLAGDAAAKFVADRLHVKPGVIKQAFTATTATFQEIGRLVFTSEDELMGVMASGRDMREGEESENPADLSGVYSRQAIFMGSSYNALLKLNLTLADLPEEGTESNYPAIIETLSSECYPALSKLASEAQVRMASLFQNSADKWRDALVEVHIMVDAYVAAPPGAPTWSEFKDELETSLNMLLNFAKVARTSATMEIDADATHAELTAALARNSVDTAGLCWFRCLKGALCCRGSTDDVIVVRSKSDDLIELALFVDNAVANIRDIAKEVSAYKATDSETSLVTLRLRISLRLMNLVKLAIAHESLKSIYPMINKKSLIILALMQGVQPDAWQSVKKDIEKILLAIAQVLVEAKPDVTSLVGTVKPLPTIDHEQRSQRSIIKGKSFTYSHRAFEEGPRQKFALGNLDSKATSRRPSRSSLEEEKSYEESGRPLRDLNRQQMSTHEEVERGSANQSLGSYEQAQQFEDGESTHYGMMGRTSRYHQTRQFEHGESTHDGVVRKPRSYEQAQQFEDTESLQHGVVRKPRSYEQAQQFEEEESILQPFRVTKSLDRYDPPQKLQSTDMRQDLIDRPTGNYQSQPFATASSGWSRVDDYGREEFRDMGRTRTYQMPTERLRRTQVETKAARESVARSNQVPYSEIDNEGSHRRPRKVTRSRRMDPETLWIQELYGEMHERSESQLRDQLQLEALRLAHTSISLMLLEHSRDMTTTRTTAKPESVLRTSARTSDSTDVSSTDVTATFAPTTAAPTTAAPTRARTTAEPMTATTTADPVTTTTTAGPTIARTTAAPTPKTTSMTANQKETTEAPKTHKPKSHRAKTLSETEVQKAGQLK